MKQLALVSIALVACPSAATANPHQDIVAVAPNPSVAQWTDALSHRLEGALRYPYAFREPTPSGGVSVTFKCSEDGAPAAIRVVRRSGSSRLDRAAVAAIHRIKSLHPLPAGMSRNQLFQANIIFAADERILAREQAALGAAFRRSSQDIALGEPRPLLLAVRLTR